MTTYQDVNQQFCELLGINPRDVTEVQITLRWNDFPKVVVTRSLINPVNWSETLKSEQFTLVPKA